MGEDNSIENMLNEVKQLRKEIRSMQGVIEYIVAVIEEYDEFDCEEECYIYVPLEN